MQQSNAFIAVEHELEGATRRYGPFYSAHEGYAIILEEMDELWSIIKRKPDSVKLEEMREEAIQVAAMAMRFLIDVC